MTSSSHRPEGQPAAIPDTPKWWLRSAKRRWPDFRKQLAATVWPMVTWRPHRDIFVFRQDGAEVTPVRFVEVKHKDAMRQRQLLGLALIQDILESPVEVVRFVSAGTRRTPATYRGDWPRGGFIRPV